MVKCSKCGFDIFAKSAAFCVNCGAPIERKTTDADVSKLSALPNKQGKNAKSRIIEELSNNLISYNKEIAEIEKFSGESLKIFAKNIEGDKKDQKELKQFQPQCKDYKDPEGYERDYRKYKLMIEEFIKDAEKLEQELKTEVKKANVSAENYKKLYNNISDDKKLLDWVKKLEPTSILQDLEGNYTNLVQEANRKKEKPCELCDEANKLMEDLKKCIEDFQLLSNDTHEWREDTQMVEKKGMIPDTPRREEVRTGRYRCENCGQVSFKPD